MHQQGPAGINPGCLALIPSRSLRSRLAQLNRTAFQHITCCKSRGKGRKTGALEFTNGRQNRRYNAAQSGRRRQGFGQLGQSGRRGRQALSDFSCG